MAEAAKVVALKTASEDDKQAAERIRETHTDELVVGICGPIGSGHHPLADSLKEQIEQFGYEVEIIKLSAIIQKVGGKISATRRFDRISALQDGGNSLRDKYGPDYLAAKTIEQISIQREARKETQKEKAYKSTRKCYIIDSIKNPAEYEILDLTYRELFYCVGIYAPMHVRERNLRQEGMTDAEIYKLIDRDSGEEIAHGQQVTDAFIKCDFFVRIESTNLESMKSQVERLLNIVFGTRIVTPTIHETSMHHAWVAAANSACLSRQVGAALTDYNGQLISVGWNDVPKFGGGLYQTDVKLENRDSDHRCMNRDGGKCFNDVEKQSLAAELFSQLVDAKLLDEHQQLEFNSAIRKTKVRGLIEFSRSIHAEMHAIISAIDSEGIRIKKGKIYTTTYPCHSCARHIVAAGISEVYYIEPYRKSLAIHLHDDSVTENETEANKVKILPYYGVAPRRYFSLFMSNANERKNSDNGTMVRYRKNDAKPVHQKSIEAIPTLEGIVVRRLGELEAASPVGGEG